MHTRSGPFDEALEATALAPRAVNLLVQHSFPPTGARARLPEHEPGRSATVGREGFDHVAGLPAKAVHHLGPHPERIEVAIAGDDVVSVSLGLVGGIGRSGGRRSRYCARIDDLDVDVRLFQSL